jgi:hypothetical protein
MVAGVIAKITPAARPVRSAKGPPAANTRSRVTRAMNAQAMAIAITDGTRSAVIEVPRPALARWIRM